MKPVPIPTRPLPPNAPPGPRSILRCAVAISALTLTGCQGISRSINSAQLRIIDASPDAPALDIYQGSANPLAYNLAFGTITSYVPVPPGATGIAVEPAGTRQHLATAAAVFAANTQYTVIVGNSVNAMRPVILKDQSQPAPAGQFAIRVVDQATRAGSVDLYLVPIGSVITAVHPVLTGMIFGANSGYFNVPAGNYTLIALPAGTVPTTAAPTAYTGSALSYPSTGVRTVILIDQPNGAASGLQVIVGSDYDPNAPVS